MEQTIVERARALRERLRSQALTTADDIITGAEKCSRKDVTTVVQLRAAYCALAIAEGMNGTLDLPAL